MLNRRGQLRLKVSTVEVSHVSQRVRHLGRHLGFFKNFILRKTIANFTEISSKHMFAASNRNIIKNRV